MSAESPHRQRGQDSGGGPDVVFPQPVTDPSILDSVTGFINDVVPGSAYNGSIDGTDKIQWAQIELLDQEESTFAPNYDGETVTPPALIIILGYSSGVQVWAVPAHGGASVILSWRHSTFRVLRILPTPFKTGAGDKVDLFASARPLIAVCDSTTNFNTLTFRSLKGGSTDTVKHIQFKSSILNALANRRSVVVTFTEKIAVFDAFTLEARVCVTTCYLSPGIQPNPVALGSRWLAYAEKKLNSSYRSSGGNDGEGVQSYTATMLHAAKSLGRGLSELTASVVGLKNSHPNYKPGTSPNSPQAGGASDVLEKGIVTVLDIENKNIKENNVPQDAVIAHFVAHTEAVVCMSFDPSGMLLLTADKRGHDFHVFRIQSHPAGPAQAAVHHLYILHRGDTTAKVQDMCFSPDSRWVAVSTLRGTTHVFPITPYGGNINVRTHATAHVVNKMSRYQRSAGLTSEGRSSSPVSVMETSSNTLFPYRNPRFPPYPQPTVVNPLAQIRQPVYVQNAGTTAPRSMPGRQRSMSSSEENISLRVAARFAPPRAYMDVSKSASREPPTHKHPVKPVESLFIMSCYGILTQYDLDPYPSASVPKERTCNDTPIELKACHKGVWPLQRLPGAEDLHLPMSKDNLSLIAQNMLAHTKSKLDHNDESWLSQVEIVTHLGPHRRLWMGPQFTFKTYTIANGAVDTRPVDVRRSKPVNMPITKTHPFVIESGSANSCEQLFLDTYHRANDDTGNAGELQLREDLADAMLESPGLRGTGGHCVYVSVKQQPPVAKVVNPLGTVVTVQSDDEVASEEAASAADDDTVIHENCDEALFRPVVAPKAVFYAEASKPRPICPPEHILTKSLAANTEVVAVRMLNSNNKSKAAATVAPPPSQPPPSLPPQQIQPPHRPVVVIAKPLEEPNNKALSSTTSSSNKPKHIVVAKPKPKSRESSPKPVKQVAPAVLPPLSSSSLKSKEAIDAENKTISSGSVKSNKVEMPPVNVVETKIKPRPRRSEPIRPPKDDVKPTPILDPFPEPPLAKADDFDILSDFQQQDSITTTDDPFGDSLFKMDKFEDAEDCQPLDKESAPVITSAFSPISKNSDEQLTCSSEEEKLVTRKTRKPKAKLGIKIPSNKQKDKDEEQEPKGPWLDPVELPPKKSWNMVAATKPAKPQNRSPPEADDFPEIECDYTFKLPSSRKDDSCLIDDLSDSITRSEIIEDFNLVKIDKSSDDEKPGSSPAETTESSDDSSKVPAIANIMDMDEELIPAQNLQGSSKASKRKSKKKRK